MSYGMHVERSFDGRRIEPGATWFEPVQQLRLQIVVVCDAVNPDVWHGEVRLGQHLLISTEPVASYDLASRKARDAIEARVVELLRGE